MGRRLDALGIAAEACQPTISFWSASKKSNKCDRSQPRWSFVVQDRLGYD